MSTFDLFAPGRPRRALLRLLACGGTVVAITGCGSSTHHSPAAPSGGVSKSGLISEVSQLGATFRAANDQFANVLRSNSQSAAAAAAPQIVAAARTYAHALAGLSAPSTVNSFLEQLSAQVNVYAGQLQQFGQAAASSDVGTEKAVFTQMQATKAKIVSIEGQVGGS
jgi:hypothetical protein